NYAAIFTGSCQSIKHTVGRCRNLDNGVFAVPLLLQVSCHHADHIRAISHEHYARVVADAFELTGLIGDLQLLRQVARNETSLMGAEDLEEIVSHFFIKDSAAVKRIE